MFAQGLYQLLKSGTVALDRSDLSVTLGCPAGWTAEGRSRYAGIVMSAGFPNLSVVSESRAAFLYARHSKELDLSPEMLAKPALVIDIGSSTTDYAYIVDGKETSVGIFGEISLGGGVLDASILDDAVQASPNREALFSEGLLQSEINKNMPSLLVKLSPAIVDVIVERGLMPVFAQVPQGVFGDKQQFENAMQTSVATALKDATYMQPVNQLNDEWAATALGDSSTIRFWGCSWPP